MTRFVGIRRLRCDSPQDQLTDEVMMQEDGHQVWPPSGWFSMSRGNEVPMGLNLDFPPGVHEKAISLYDHEDIGHDDFMGRTVIRDDEPLNQLQTRTLAANGAVYQMVYGIGERSDF